MKTKLISSLTLVSLICFAIIITIQTVSSKNMNEEMAQGSTVFAADINTAQASSSDDALMLYVGSPNALVNNNLTLIDRENLEVVPLVENSRTLVPLRFVSEAFNALVSWDAKNETATIRVSDNDIVVALGDKALKLNSVTNNLQRSIINMDTPAKKINSRVYVPLRYIAEALGKEVFYDRGLIIISNIKDIFSPTNDKQKLDEIIATINNLPVIGDEESLRQLVQAYILNPRSTRPVSAGISRGSLESVEAESSIASDDSVAMRQSVPTTAAPPSTSQDTSKAVNEPDTDYSKTNTQVFGVDEADVVKTDGTYIYYIVNNNLYIVNAQEMKLISTLNFDETNFRASEMYVDNNQLVAIGEIELKRPANDEPIKEDYSYYPRGYMTSTYIFDITDKTAVKKTREVDIEGYYITSRKIDNSLYMLSKLDIYNLYSRFDDSIQLPQYRDTAKSEAPTNIEYNNIRYFPNFRSYSYTIVAGIKLDEPKEETAIYTYLGASDNIYVSNENMYVTTMASADYDVVTSIPTRMTSDETFSRVARIDQTQVYKFSLTDGNITYLCKNKVPGQVLNQFSMDENNGYFRIATTQYDYRNGKQSNNMYILDDVLSISGRLENIAPGEQIYSVRYMGDRGYMVTFKTVDPLFVVDLADPKNPKILGALKIPGYSNYLHPYDENHLIGFGKDTFEYNGSAFYKGIKMSMFDVSDVSDPKELFTEIIGDRGTESPLLQNHKALLFSKEKNLLAFPVALMEIEKNSSSQNDMFEYGVFKFQGAYVYNIDLNNGFDLKGKITHLSEDDLLKSSNHNSDQQKYIDRIIYISDNLYTLSPSMIKSNDIDSIEEKGFLELN